MNNMYQVCKRIIERNNYPENMSERIETFYKANLITEEEYKKLMNMLK